MKKYLNLTHWNHRVEKTQEGFSIVEAFYNGKEVLGTTESIVGPYETLDELKIELKRMVLACKKPVLEY